ncbi:MAG: toll/interleukin-1 receptor domain-containing protein [Anaerolineales bacterium]|nr:toll/interleukin-1 receptor domain-containing protein [Anaerolineales bacterium]
MRELSRQLMGEGWIDIWRDEKNLLPGQDWRVKIEEAVEEADVVIICLSNHSVSKEGHVQKELRYAREIALEKPEDAIFLIPLRLEECEVPRGLRFYQWVDYFGESKDSSYKALVTSLEYRYEQKIKIEEKRLKMPML